MTALRILVAAVIVLLSLASMAEEPAVRQSIGGHIDDAVITAKVKNAYFNDPVISAFDVKVETFNGRVLLSGFADKQSEIDKAVALARAVPGVKSVENALRLKQE